MKLKTKNSRVRKPSFGEALGFTELSELVTELLWLRQAPPEVTETPGHREGDILGFVRGLRLSARLTYFLRERLSGTQYEVDWGHLLDAALASCSPECDIVIHTKGHHRRWNGGEHPIMDFRFIQASAARAVISCKSTLSAIDTRYPQVVKTFGVKQVFLFAECCKESRFEGLRKTAKNAGYAGLYCLYFTNTNGMGVKQDERLYAAFVKSVSKVVGQ